MKARLLLLAALALTTAVLLAFGFPNSSTAFTKDRLIQTRQVIKCSPDWNALQTILEETDIPPVPGTGTYQWKIGTTSDSAQFYFNQGINLYYCFHIIESMASFKKAAKFDPGSPMLYWAQALAYGPNINDLGYAASPEALAATNKARELSGTASPVEAALIDAMSVRYTADSADLNRKKLNEAYTAKMKTVYEKFPDHPDVEALYADAMMLEHPWNLWNMDGTPKEWTPLIQETLEKLLARTPQHPGANHYYIHVMEPSPNPGKALASADRLGALTPGVSHTVHMPSHIYLRTGQYVKGSLVNEQAVKSYRKLIPLYAPVTGNAFLYEIHNLHMQTNHALLSGRSGYAVWSAKETVKSIPADYLPTPGALGNYLQYLYMTPALVYVRYGNWTELLKMPAPPASMIYGNIIYRFARGIAYTQHSNLIQAKKELEQLQELLKDSSLLLPFTPFSPAIDGAVVAENLLIGSIALKEKRYSDAIAAFEEAAVTEEGMVYNEPRDWMLNPKHYLGNAYLKAGRLQEARKTLEADLQNNRENGWALFGIWQVLTKEKKTTEAAKMLARFRKAFDKADIKLYGPVF
jgi:tetratricopeptide (TPR) repeat protein